MLPLDGDRNAALDAALDQVRGRFGTASLTRAVLLGRDTGLERPAAARLTPRRASTLPAMCFDLDSLPPIPAIAGAAVSHRDVVLEAADGTRLAAFAASPDGPARTGVVVLPDVRGLYRFYEELVLRLAERGYHAVAFDYFGRTAGVSKRDDDFAYPDHVAADDARGRPGRRRRGRRHLRSAAGGSCAAVLTVGFCFGAAHSWLAAAAGHDLAGAVGFYGSTGERNGQPGPVQLAGRMTAPILGLQAGDDAHITAADNAALDEALTAAGVEHEIVTYPGAPHSFFDRKHEEFADASADAWTRVVAFLERHGA